MRARAPLSEVPPVEPDRCSDPVAAVRAAHAEGRLLSLPTSGTTGAPRRVQRTTASWWSSFDAYTALTGVDAGARPWVPGPLSATMNLFAAVHADAVGASLAEGPADATHACLTPAQLDRLGPQLRRGAHVVVAGDRLPEPLLEQARRAGLRVAHYYGASELSFVADSADGGPLTPFAGVEVEVRDGEIWVRSPYLCLGTTGRPGALRRDDEGWATVGDLGAYDGTLTVHGRPEHLVTAGATVSLAEVEAVLAAATGAPLAVCGLPHPTLGAVLAAVLTDPADRPAVAAYARTHLSPAQRPRVWRTLARLPMTAAGKVDRQALARELGGADA